MEKISVVVSCYNEEKALPLFYEEMERVRKKRLLRGAGHR